MNQSQFLAITSNSLKAREQSRGHDAIGFDFASHWLKNWRESFTPITNRSNRNHVITFNNHLKTVVQRAGLSADRLFRNTKRVMRQHLISHQFQQLFELRRIDHSEVKVEVYKVSSLFMRVLMLIIADYYKFLSLTY